MAETPWLTVAQVAQRAQRHPKTVLTALRRGELRGSQPRANACWRIRVEDVDAWIGGDVVLATAA